MVIISLSSSSIVLLLVIKRLLPQSREIVPSELDARHLRAAMEALLPLAQLDPLLLFCISCLRSQSANTKYRRNIK